MKTMRQQIAECLQVNQGLELDEEGDLAIMAEAIHQTVINCIAQACAIAFEKQGIGVDLEMGVEEES